MLTKTLEAKRTIENHNTTNRDFSLDLIRTIAVMAVVMAHFSGTFVNAYESNTFEYIIANIFNSISRLCVPLFVMVSGALMLNEKKELTTALIYKKYISKIALLFLFWSICYSVFDNILTPINNGKPIILEDFFIGIFIGSYHLWFLYMIIGLYIITPILRCFVKKENANIILYFICVALVFQFTLPIIDYISAIYPKFHYIASFINNFKVESVCGFVTYYLLGWYFYHIGFSKKVRNLIIAIGTVSLLIIIIATQINPSLHKITFSNMNLFILLYSAAVFVLIHSFYKGNNSLNKIVKLLSTLSFGTYIIHAFIISLFSHFFMYPGKCCIIFIIIKWLSIYVVSTLITFLLSKIPIIKKLVKA